MGPLIFPGGGALRGGVRVAGRVLSLARAAFSSRRLGRALEAAGHTRFAGAVAHHIAAGASPGAAPARAALQKFGIGIDDAANGVFLEKSAHARLHTNAYYKTVNNMLDQATSKSEALEVLGTIRAALARGEFP